MEKRTDIDGKSNTAWFHLVWCVPLLILAVITFLYGLTTSVTYELYQEIDLQSTSHAGRVPLVILTVAAVAVLYLLLKKTRVFERKYAAVAFILTLTAVSSLFLVLSVRGLATNDALKLDAIANAFLDGDISELKEKGSYLYVYPFQIGYVGYCQLVALIFGKSNFLAHQLVNIIAVITTLYFLIRLSKELFDDERLKNFTALFCLGAVFLTVYTTFVYGDIVSLAPQASGLFFLCRFIREEKIRDASLGGILLGISLVLKTNTYIALIAAVIVIALRLIELRKKALLAGCVLFVILTLMPNAALKEGYKAAFSLDALPEGVPSSTYFAMGIQDNGYGQAGWYNGYNANTYRENGYDHALTDEVAKARFSEDFAALASSPSGMVRFYGKKFLSQWGDASCISLRELELTSRHVEGHGDIVNSIIYGRGRDALYLLMQVFHLLVFGGSALFLFSLIKKKLAGRSAINPAQSMILLYVFGGMLFHEIWEGSSRYTMRYYIFLIPFAACGIYELLNDSRRS